MHLHSDSQSCPVSRCFTGAYSFFVSSLRGTNHGTSSTETPYCHLRPFLWVSLAKHSLSLKTAHVPLCLFFQAGEQCLHLWAPTHNTLWDFPFSKAPDVFDKGDVAREVSYMHHHNNTQQQPVRQANLPLCLCARLFVVCASSCLSVLQLVPVQGARCPWQLQGGDSTVPGFGNDGETEIVEKLNVGRRKIPSLYHSFPCLPLLIKKFCWTDFHLFHITHIWTEGTLSVQL